MQTDSAYHPLVSVVILSYNRCHDLEHTLQQVFLQDYKNYEVIVADNASNDGTKEMLAREFPQVILAALENNIGIAGWNEGAKIAKGDYLLFLDDDSYPVPNALSKVFAANLDASTVYALEIRTVENKLYAPHLQYEQPLRTFIGCGVVIPKKLFEQVGRYHTSLFLYYHEVEFCLRVYQYGAKVCYVPQAIVIHVSSPVHRTDGMNYQADQRRAYYFNRNILFIVCNYFPLWTGLGRITRFVVGRWLFAVSHGTGWITFKGCIVGMSLAFQQRHNRIVLSVNVCRLYENGKYFASFFGDGTFAFQRPRWL
jgi:GT2 family glycosyltransferase